MPSSKSSKQPKTEPKYNLSAKSKRRLAGVHPTLAAVVRRALQISDIDFSVNAGVRTALAQNKLYQKGRSKPGKKVTYKDGYRKRSNHQTKGDGWGHSVDLTPYPLDWDKWSDFELVRDAMFKAAEQMDVQLIWGGDWKTLRDGPHFELKA
jgi:peptidoglycan L-alanyl-D-glutamate endopeptidase CwlK